MAKQETINQILENTIATIKTALDLPSNAEIRQLSHVAKTFKGEVSIDGENWYSFVVGEKEAKIIALV